MGGSQRVPFQARGVREGQLVDSPPPPPPRSLYTRMSSVKWRGCLGTINLKQPLCCVAGKYDFLKQIKYACVCCVNQIAIKAYFKSVK